MRNDLDIRVLVEQAGHHDAPHRHARLVRPTERPPHVVPGAILRRVVGELSGTRWVQPDRQIVLSHLVEQRLELRVVQRPAVDVREYLYALGPQVLDRPVGLLQRSLDVVQRQRRHETRKPIRVLCGHFRHPVVRDLRQLGAVLRPRDNLDRRKVQREHLLVVLPELVDLVETSLNVVQHRNRRYALHHVRALGAHPHHLVVVRLRQDVVENIYLHVRLHQRGAPSPAPYR